MNNFYISNGTFASSSVEAKAQPKATVVAQAKLVSSVEAQVEAKQATNVIVFPSAKKAEPVVSKPVAPATSWFKALGSFVAAAQAAIVDAAVVTSDAVVTGFNATCEAAVEAKNEFVTGYEQEVIK